MFGTKRLGLTMAVAILGVAWSASSGFLMAQGPGDGGGAQDGPPGMGPHRPPMERLLGPGGMRGEHGRWWNDAKAIEKFKLTDSQRKSMDDIFQQSRVGLVDLHASLEKLEIEMEPMMKADQPDEGKILAQIDRVAQARAELEKANAKMLLGIRSKLTPEQWKQLEADRATRHENRGPGGLERRWHGQPGAGGPEQTPGPGGENE